MTMKKRLGAILTASALALGLLAGCGGSPAKSQDTAGSTGSAQPSGGGESAKKSVVNLWATGSDNVREVYESLIEDFHKNSPYAEQYEVKLQFMLSGTGAQSMADMLAAAKKANQEKTDYDLVDFSGDDLSKVVSLIGEDSFVRLDTLNIPNAANVAAKSSVATDYAQPFRGTTVILAYDSSNVPAPPATMDELVTWMKKHPGRFAYNTPGTGGAGDSYVRYSVYNFLPEEAFTSDDPKWMEQWDKGFAFLKELHPFMYSSGGSIVYPNKNQGTLDLLNQGEIDMCANWADMVLSQRASGEIRDSIKITQIDPSFTGSLQTLAVPGFGSNPDGAAAFIDYMLSPGAQELMVREMAAIPLIDASSMDMTGYEDLEGLDVSSFRLQSIGDLSTKFNERWDNEIATLS